MSLLWLMEREIRRADRQGPHHKDKKLYGYHILGGYVVLDGNPQRNAQIEMALDSFIKRSASIYKSTLRGLLASFVFAICLSPPPIMFLLPWIWAIAYVLVQLVFSYVYENVSFSSYLDETHARTLLLKGRWNKNLTDYEKRILHFLFSQSRTDEDIEGVRRVHHEMMKKHQMMGDRMDVEEPERVAQNRRDEARAFRTVQIYEDILNGSTKMPHPDSIPHPLRGVTITAI